MLALANPEVGGFAISALIALGATGFTLIFGRVWRSQSDTRRHHGAGRQWRHGAAASGAAT